MLNKNFILLLLCFSFIEFSFQTASAKSPKENAITKKQEINLPIENEKKDKNTATIEEKDTDTEEDTEEDKEEDTEENIEEKEILPKLTRDERAKCKKLKTALVGNRFDGLRVASFLTSHAAGYGIEATALALFIVHSLKKEFQDKGLLKAIENKYDNVMVNPLRYAMAIAGKTALTISAAYLTSYLASLCIHFGLLKKQKVSAITSTIEGAALNPVGLAIYSLLHRFVLSSNLINVLENYDQNEIPACVKAKVDKLMQKYDDSNNIEMNAYQRSTFVIEILATLDKALRRK